MKKKTSEKTRLSLTLLFSVMVLITLVMTLLAVWGAVDLLVVVGVLKADFAPPDVNRIMLIVLLISLILGSVLTFITARFPLQPFNRIIQAMNRLAAGHYDTRLTFGRFLSKQSAFREVSDSFNRMAEELGNTEMLRSDFINHFSHEFKTPIMSITGFASLLKKGNLPKEQQLEYLTIIEEESMRLASLATHVLNLTKLENQSILTGSTSFNLSEQLRSCVLLLESKWSQKHLEMDVEMEEYEIEANEEQLREVWINLLDNAVKFSMDYGTVRLDVTQRPDTLSVSISDTGAPIPPESIDRIFQKFYQADSSHATEGNGVGLAIVRKVVELHQGDIQVRSQDGVTTFTVTLPRRQTR